MMRRAVLPMAVLALVAAGSTAAGQARPKVSANSLKADVSFLASDVLQGRATPSPGLDVAAEFIAAEYRRIGLEPLGDDGYFQTASYESITPSLDGLALTLEVDGRAVTVERGRMSLQEPVAVDFTRLPAVLVDAADPGALERLEPGQVRGKALVVEYPDDPARAATIARRLPSLGSTHGPALIVVLRTAPVMSVTRPRMREADGAPRVPALVVGDAAVRDAVRGARSVTVTARVPAPAVQPLKFRNVAGVLRGADPTLRNAYVVLSAHYDHLGARPAGEGDRILNGANDNASGVATVIETARALAALPAKPKRSIVFLALFGEEVGGFGSRYYCQHPLVPLASTVANVNFEQIGRTDDREGARLRQFNLTGFDYTTLAGVFGKAAAEVGVKAVKHEKWSDPYFNASDNAAFAEMGVPSTTISVTYQFPDYHGMGDEWGKIDYDNMAVVVEAIARGVSRLATDAKAPEWNTANPRVARYVQAREKK